MTAEDFIAWAGLLVGVVIGISTIFIALMQTRIAARQNEISEALRDIELNRDSPHLVITGCELTNTSREHGVYTGVVNAYIVTFTVLNVGGSDAWNVIAQLIRVRAITLENHAAEDPDFEPDIDGSDTYLDMLLNDSWGKIGLIRSGKSVEVAVEINSILNIDEITSVEVLEGTFASRGARHSRWRTEAEGTLADTPWPTSEEWEHLDYSGRTPLNEPTQ